MGWVRQSRRNVVRRLLRRDVSGMLKQVGTYAKAASATAPTNQANILQIMYYKATAAATTYTTMFSNSGKSFIAGGIPVRCVKE